MENLQRIKDEYAVELGYLNFEDITGQRSVFVVESIFNDVAMRYAQHLNKELVTILLKTHSLLIKRQYPTDREIQQLSKEIELAIKNTLQI